MSNNCKFIIRQFDLCGGTDDFMCDQLFSGCDGCEERNGANHVIGGSSVNDSCIGLTKNRTRNKIMTRRKNRVF
jgi:hypothetical protein